MSFSLTFHPLEIEKILKKKSSKSNFPKNVLKFFLNHHLVKSFKVKSTFKKKTICSKNKKIQFSTFYHTMKEIVGQVRDLESRLEFLRLLGGFHTQISDGLETMDQVKKNTKNKRRVSNFRRKIKQIKEWEQECEQECRITELITSISNEVGEEEKQKQLFYLQY